MICELYPNKVDLKNQGSKTNLLSLFHPSVLQQAFTVACTKCNERFTNKVNPLFSSLCELTLIHARSNSAMVFIYIPNYTDFTDVLSQPYKEQRMGIIISHSTFPKSSYITYCRFLPNQNCISNCLL